ncbi:hypothetical protein D4764_16G0008290 [Takifugu flavidus]|uniref:Uncharacterized protein n=1 Tax=Takifugu flavidus TaxID=433684 RepID=A0A5C6NXW0_9TELE|nr:hypothetical protein D4764_16G0008290 [Takifugu flavidus]
MAQRRETREKSFHPPALSVETRLGGYCGEEIGGCGGPPWAAHKKLPNPLPRSQLTPCGLLRLPAGEEAQRGFRDQRIRVRSLAFAGRTTRGQSVPAHRAPSKEMPPMGSSPALSPRLNDNRLHSRAHAHIRARVCFDFGPLLSLKQSPEAAPSIRPTPRPSHAVQEKPPRGLGLQKKAIKS